MNFKAKKKKMKNKFKNGVKRLGEWVIVVTVVFLILYINKIISFNVKEKTYVENSGNNGIYITAEHIPQKDIDSKYTLIYADKIRDIAYYIDTSYERPKVAKQEVNIAGLTNARIISSKYGEFEVSVSNPEAIVSGMSGMRVYDKNNKKVLGFVIALEKGGILKCLSVD